MNKIYGILTIDFFNLDPSEDFKKEILGYDEDEEVEDEDIESEWEDYINLYDVEEQMNYYDLKVLKRKDISSTKERYILKGDEEDIEYLKDHFWPFEYPDSCKLEILTEEDIDDLIIRSL